jgi:methyl-accepting chemotaxis protein
MNWYKNLNAQPRLAIAFGVILSLTLGVGYLAVTGLFQANQRMAGLYSDMSASTALDSLALAKADKSKQDRDALLNISDTQAMEKAIKAGQADIETMHRDLETADQLLYNAHGKAILAQVRAGLPAYEKCYAETIALLRAGDAVGVRASFERMNAAAAPIADGINQLRDFKAQLAQEKFKTNTAAYQSVRNLTISAIVGAVLIGSLLAFFIARGFSVPLAKAVAALENVAAGDLTAELQVHTHDEVGRMAVALNSAVRGLRTTMQEVGGSAAETTSSARQLSSASESIASGAQEQAASLEETSASLEQITASVRQTADSARQASQLAASSTDSALQGRDVVGKAIVAMSEINAASRKISEIISTIDEIAFQTNLLAVNAAVEAARAGEEGRGFAVVASEVRSLAQRSSDAAKEIKGLIQDSVRKVESGSSLVNRSGETLEGIVNSVKRVTDIIGEIAAAAAEQSAGIEQVNTAMTQMDQVTQSNSAQTEELAATAESLSGQASQLLELIQRFKVGEEEDSAPHANVRRSAGVRAKGRSAAKPKQKPPARAVSTAPVLAAAISAPAMEFSSDFENF